MEPTGYLYTHDKKKRYYDYTLLFMVVTLILIGVMMIASISPYNAARYYNDELLYTRGQIRYAIVGIAGMIAVSLFDYHVYSTETPVRKIPFLLVGAYIMIVALELAVIILGRTDSGLNGATNGAARWLAVGPFKLQPGEFAKLFMIVIAAYALCRMHTQKNKTVYLGIVLGLFGVITLLAAKESMTTGIVLGAILVGLVFVCSKKKLVFVVLLAVVVVVAILVVRYVDRSGGAGGFRFRRIYEWRHLTDEENVGQVKQGLYALSSGGLFGKGLGNSAQKLGHIPEVHTDMIFACIVEELGLVGGAALLILFLLLLWRIAIIAINAPDLYGTLLCYGVMIHIGLQVCINVAVVTGSMPSTGVTLPFISYGGSSLIVLCAECGLVLNVSRNIGYRKREVLKQFEEKPATARETGESGRSAGKRTFGGFRKIKDDHKKTRPVRGKAAGSSGGKNTKSAKGRRDGTDNADTGKPTPQAPSGGYRMDVVLGRPSKRDSSDDDS